MVTGISWQSDTLGCLFCQLLVRFGCPTPARFPHGGSPLFCVDWNPDVKVSRASDPRCRCGCATCPCCVCLSVRVLYRTWAQDSFFTRIVLREKRKCTWRLFWEDTLVLSSCTLSLRRPTSVDAPSKMRTRHRTMSCGRIWQCCFFWTEMTMEDFASTKRVFVEDVVADPCALCLIQVALAGSCNPVWEQHVGSDNADTGPQWERKRSRQLRYCSIVRAFVWISVRRSTNRSGDQKTSHVHEDAGFISTCWQVWHFLT